jgi:predicted permease
MAGPDNPYNKNAQSVGPSAEISVSKTGAFGGNGGPRADAHSNGGTGAHGAAAQNRKDASESKSGAAGDYSQSWQSRAESVLQDFRFAVRTLRKSGGFTLTVVLTLALGIGANTAIFQLIDAVRLRSLPVADPATLAAVRVQTGTRGFGITVGDDYETMLSYPMWEEIRRHQQSFSNVFAWAQTGWISLGEGAQERRTQILWVSGEMFSVLGVPPLRGRVFTDKDDQPNCGLPGVVISYALWQSEFGGQESAIGSRLIIEGNSTQVIGVTPRGFFGLEVGRGFDIAVPFCSLTTYAPAALTTTRSDFFWLHVVGRLKQGVTLEQASSQLNAISPGLVEMTLPSGYSTASLNIYKNFRLAAYPGGKGISWLRQTYDTSLWLLLGTTGLVLLIACANLANLMLVRASAREREMAVRLSLGASRWRLIRQLLSEGFVLAVAGGVLGVALAEIFSRSLVRLLSTGNNPIQLGIGLEWRVLLFTGALTISTCIFVALVPAFRSSRAQPGLVLKTGSRGTTAGRERFSFQRLLVASQIAVSVVLLVGALLFARSFWNLVTLDPGFREKGILVIYVDLKRLALPEERHVPFIRDLLAAVKTVPQVESSATSTHIPLNSNSTWNLGVRVNGAEGGSKFAWVSPEYFETMQIPLLSGRGFNDRDTQTSPHVAVVNEAFTRRYLAGMSATGKTLRTNAESGYPETEYEIVGVVKDTKYTDLREPTPPMVFAPADQFPDARPWAVLLIRSSSPPRVAIAAVKEKISQISPAIKTEFHIFQTDIENGLGRERLMALLSGFFGALAALLAMIGLYGVMSYIVAMRKNEIGIRIALGASRGSVIGIIVRQTLVLLGVGLGAGLVLSFAAARGANSLLYGLQATDPLTLFSAAGFLAVVALAASYIPAYRASRVDPMNALRYE